MPAPVVARLSAAARDAVVASGSEPVCMALAETNVVSAGAGRRRCVPPRLPCKADRRVDGRLGLPQR
jgi:hypothetical protein